MTDFPVRLSMKFACSRAEAEAFYAVVIFLYERDSDPAAQADPDLQQYLGSDPETAITAIVPNLASFGIESEYDHRAGELIVTDIDGKPDAKALWLILNLLYPHKLPLVARFHTDRLPANPFWTIFERERIVISPETAQTASPSGTPKTWPPHGTVQ